MRLTSPTAPVGCGLEQHVPLTPVDCATHQSLYKRISGYKAECDQASDFDLRSTHGTTYMYQHPAEGLIKLLPEAAELQDVAPHPGLLDGSITIVVTRSELTQVTVGRPGAPPHHGKRFVT